ncbi:MAG: RepB family plasmid replication initiator protein [Desulforhopalus sp.]|nr:RepB family plasmid replication initiator protein [Desulforhopalus sp.]
MRKEVIKHSAAIQISNNCTLLQRRLYNVLLAHAYSMLPYEETHSAPVDDICTTLGYESKNTGYLKDSLLGLLTTYVQWNVLGKDGHEDWKASNLLAEVGITNGVCNYSFSPFLRKKLYNPEVYAKISLSLQNEFGSKHALALYELLKDYFDIRKAISRTPYFTVTEFRTFLGLAETEYKDFKILSRDIIKKAIKEINKVSDLYIEVQFRRIGRSIGKMQFIIRRNSDNCLKVEAIEIKPKQLRLPETTLNIANQDLLKTLLDEFGITLNVAVKLLENYDEFQIVENLEVVRQAHKKGQVSSLSGYTVKAIKDDYRLNNSPVLKEKEEKKKRRKLAEELKEKEEKKRLEQYNKERQEAMHTFSQLPQEQQKKIITKFEADLHPTVQKAFVDSDRNISSPVYSGTFFEFLKKTQRTVGKRKESV